MTPEERATKIVEDFREKEVANEGPTHDYCVEAIAAAIREAVKQSSGSRPKETFASVGEWAVSTFGPGTVKRRLERAGEELEEAIADAHVGAPIEEIMAEIADVLICLCGAARVAGGDLQSAFDDKMAINRARQWSLRGDGTGYHIKRS